MPIQKLFYNLLMFVLSIVDYNVDGSSSGDGSLWAGNVPSLVLLGLGSLPPSCPFVLVLLISCNQRCLSTLLILIRQSVTCYLYVVLGLLKLGASS